MAIQSLFFGALLTALAAFGYYGAAEGSRSLTALIPLAVGVPLLICGLVAFNERYRMHAMHVAACFGLLGMLAAGGRGIPGLIKLMSAESAVNPRAVTMVLIMFALCTAFLILCVKSFIDARRRQRAQAA
jgi:hypothetical protein